MKLFTWTLADAIAAELITAMGAFKMVCFGGTPPAVGPAVSPSLADGYAQAFQTAMGGFHIHLFTGSQPLTSTALAGDLTGYTRLITYKGLTSSNLPINWATQVAGSGQSSRDMTQSVNGVAANTGIATWGVITPAEDALTASGTAKRFAFSVGTGADVALTASSITAASTYTLSTSDYLYVTYGGTAALAGAFSGQLITYLDAGGSAGISWDTEVAGAGEAKRLMSQAVSGNGAVAGSITYALICPVADALAASPTAIRALFSVGTAGQGYNFSMDSTAIAVGLVYPFPVGVEIFPCSSVTA